MRKQYKFIPVVLFLAVLITQFQNCSDFASQHLSLGAGLAPRNKGSATPITSAQATNAFGDMVAHYWAGDHIVRTWYGYTSQDLPASLAASAPSQSGLWERTQFSMLIYSQFLLTNDQTYANMLASDWAYLKTQFPMSKLTDCSGASDDDAWEANAEIMTYKTTHAQDALDTAKALVACSYSHFQSPNNSQHGLWYSDQHLTSSTYEAGLALAAWDIFTITGDQTFYNYAVATYTWIARDLIRSDGLYTTEWDMAANQPKDASTAKSLLPGNMAMAILSARFFAKTGDDSYRQRAVAITKGLLSSQLDTNGVIVNGRDANTDGAFAVPYVLEVLSLSGIPTQIHKAIKATANSIQSVARTSDGYYLAEWGGESCCWTLGGYSPKELLVSVQGVQMIIAAAVDSPTFRIHASESAASTDTDTDSDSDADDDSDTDAGNQNPGPVVASTTDDQDDTSSTSQATAASSQAAAQAQVQAQAQAQAQADAQAHAQAVAAAQQAAQQQAAAVQAAAQQSMQAAQAAAAAAFAARQTQSVYRYVGKKGEHLFALSGDGATIPNGFHMEGPIFADYVVSYASNTPLFRCNNAGHQFLSVDPGCEGQTNRGQIGFISTVQVGNLVPLYRMSGGGGDYLQATSTDEGTNAGYSVEGVLGFVPPG